MVYNYSSAATDNYLYFDYSTEPSKIDLFLMDLPPPKKQLSRWVEKQIKRRGWTQ